MTEEYFFCFLHFNKGWSVVSVQNNCSSSPSRGQSINSNQSSIKDWWRCFPNRCMWPPWEAV